MSLEPISSMVGVSSRVGISIIGYAGAAARRAATPTSYETYAAGVLLVRWNKMT